MTRTPLIGKASDKRMTRRRLPSGKRRSRYWAPLDAIESDVGHLPQAVWLYAPLANDESDVEPVYLVALRGSKRCPLIERRFRAAERRNASRLRRFPSADLSRPAIWSVRSDLCAEYLALLRQTSDATIKSSSLLCVKSDDCSSSLAFDRVKRRPVTRSSLA